MRRCALLLCVIAVFGSSQTFAQSLTGSWVGTYSFTAATEGPNRCCQNLPDPIRSTGRLTAVFVQSGSSFTGFLIVHGIKSKKDPAPCPTSSCSLVEIPLGGEISGTISGSVVSATLPLGPEEGSLLISGTLTDNALSGTLRDVPDGGSGEFSLSRSEPAAVDLTGSWRGSYHFVDDCSNTSSGDLTANLTQTSGVVGGSVTLSGLGVEAGRCNIVARETATFTISGQLIGNAFNAFIVSQDEEVQGGLEGTVEGTRLSGVIISPGVVSSSFSMDRASGPPAVRSFTATPDTIRLGQSATLSWTTNNATGVTIEPGVGGKPPQGSITVAPSSTTTYTLTAVGPGGNATAQVTVNVVAAADVRVSLLPSALVQVETSGGATTTYALTNVGGASTEVTVDHTDNFYTQSPTSSTLAPGGSEIVTITASAMPAGTFRGTITVSGAGVPAGLTIPVQLLSVVPPAGPAVAVPTANRVDVAADLGSASAGTARFTNTGTAAVVGLVSADVPWLVVPTDPITIAPGGTADVAFSIDRSKRPDAGTPFGSASGTLSLTYLSGTASGKIAPANGASSTSKSHVTVVDTTKPPVASSPIPPLQPGEFAYVIPGIRSGTDRGSDLSILSVDALSDLKLYYVAFSGEAAVASLTQVQANTPVPVADVAKAVFDKQSEVGTLIMRPIKPDRVSVTATLFNSNHPAGTHGTSIPVFRSDRGVIPGGSVVLTGLRNDATTQTDLYIQEMAGAAASARIEYFNIAGVPVASRTDSLLPHRLAVIPDAVPVGAVSAIVTNEGTSTGRIVAYATPTDRLSGDSWTVIDSRQQFGYSPSEAVVIPVAGSHAGRNNTQFRTDLALMNFAPIPAKGSLRYYGDAGEAVERPVTLGALQSSIISNVVVTAFGIITPSRGYIVYTPSEGAVALSSRTYTTTTQNATFGTGVPALALSSSLRAGEIRRIGGVEDASLTTILAARPATFRTNFALLETAGENATVRVTMRYSLVSGKEETLASASKEYSLTPRQFLLLINVAREILGPSRDSVVGELRNLQLDFQVTSSTGAVSVFTSTVENGTNDSTLRIE